MKEDRATQPLTDYALLAAYTNQRSILDALANTLCCPLCFEPFAKNEVVSLACSHTFCSPCIERWASASVQTQLQIPVELARGQVRPECPECRGDASKSGRVRVIMLEEAIRVLQRFVRACLSIAFRCTYKKACGTDTTLWRLCHPA